MPEDDGSHILFVFNTPAENNQIATSNWSLLISKMKNDINLAPTALQKNLALCQPAFTTEEGLCLGKDLTTETFSAIKVLITAKFDNLTLYEVPYFN